MDEITRKRQWRSLVVRSLWLLLIAGAAWWLWSQDFGVHDFLSLIQTWGVVPFFVALALLPLVGFPTTPFYVVAGAAFDLWPSLIGTAVALAVQLCLAYWMVTRWLRQVVERWVKRRRYEIPELSAGNHLAFTVAVRMAPGVPVILKHCVLGVAGVPFKIFFWTSWFLGVSFAASLIVLGDSLFDRQYWGLAAALGIAVALAALGIFARKRLMKRKQD